MKNVRVDLEDSLKNILFASAMVVAYMLSGVGGIFIALCHKEGRHFLLCLLIKGATRVHSGQGEHNA
jgi:hypothetical protein